MTVDATPRLGSAPHKDGPALTSGSPGDTGDPDIAQRWRDGLPFLALGGVAIVAGGIVAAIARPLDIDLGSWTAAFLVLVGGVAQIGLGVGQAWLTGRRPPARLRNLELLGWNIGGLLTIAGTFAAAPVITSLAGVILVATLAAFLVGTRVASDGARRWHVAYRGLVIFVLGSIPVGLLLAWVRHR